MTSDSPADVSPSTVDRNDDSEPRYGVMHVHTNFSDGGIDIEDAIAAAQRAELDFLFITDHNTIEARQYEGYHDNLLLAVDVEISPTPFWNHVIALGLSDYDELHRLKDPGAILDAILEQGGVPWVPHPRGFFNPYCGVFNLPWRVWDTRVRGLELSTFCVEWVESLRPWNLPSAFRNPARFVRGPHPRLLRRWDALNAGSPQPVPAYVGLDAHYRSLLNGKIQTPSYEFLFRTNNILAWTPPRTGDVAADLRSLRDTLTSGEFVSVMTHIGGRNPIRLHGAAGELGLVGVDDHSGTITTRLLQDGRVVDHGHDKLNYSNLDPGRYRVEIDHQGRLWALTNPVDVVAAAPSPRLATASSR